MMPGFVAIDCHRFYTEAWPLIEQRGDALASNRAEIKTCLKEQRPAPPLLIYWGYKDANTGEKIVLAVSRSSGTGTDEHWIDPALIAN